MTRQQNIPIILLLFLFILNIFFAFPLFAEDTLTITTYYPSPYGVYRELRAKRIAIGDDYIDGASYTWQDTESGSGEVDFAADLVVEGNVGIGTVNPVGILNTKTATGVNSVIIADTADSLGSRANYLSFRFGGTEKGFVGYGSASKSVLYLNNDGINALVLNSVGGNVGIGTTSPYSKLHIHGPHNSEVMRLSQVDDGAAEANDGPSLTFYNDVNNQMLASIKGAFDRANGNYGNLIFGTRTTDALGVEEKMRILYNGNVGIGTTSPGAKLQIGAGTGSLHVAAPGLLIKNSTSYDRSMMEIHDPTGANRLVIQTLAGTSYIASLDTKPLALQTAGGNVGIGTASPAQALDITGNIRVSGGTFFTSIRSTNFFLALQADRNMVLYDNGSAVWQSGTSTSDIRLKKDVKELKGFLPKVLKWRAVSFKWKDPQSGAEPQIGLIAQEVEPAFPELIFIDKKGYKLIDYPKVTVVLLGALQEQQRQLEALQVDIAFLKQKIAE